MVNLGLHSGPLTEIFPMPRTAEDWAPYVLSEERVDAFERDGFIHGVPLLTSPQVDALAHALTEIMVPGHRGAEYFYEYHANEQEDASSVLFHALGAWRVRAAFHDVLWSPAFLMAAYQLLGTGFRLFHDQVFAKPPRHGGEVPWHQDYSYWTWTKPMAHLTAWMALDDVDTKNGCVHYVPGSHRWGLIEKTGFASDMEAVRETLTPSQMRSLDAAVPAEMARGEGSFHHPLTLHGSYANGSDRPRRATLINVFADGVRSNLGENAQPGTGGYPHVPRGQPMGGPFYPLLLDPKERFPSFLQDIPTVQQTLDR